MAELNIYGTEDVMLVKQRIEEFYTYGLLQGGANQGRSLGEVIEKMNKEGLRVNQICPMGLKGNGEVSHGVILCTEVE